MRRPAADLVSRLIALLWEARDISGHFVPSCLGGSSGGNHLPVGANNRGGAMIAGRTPVKVKLLFFAVPFAIGVGHLVSNGIFGL